MSQLQLTNQLPNINAPLVRVELLINGQKFEGKGFIIPPWNSYLQQFTQKPSAVITQEVSASPYNLTPNANGKIIITGGTISEILLIRGATSIDITGKMIIPIRIEDTIQVTYSVLPTIYFLPD
jgi:hypothetical protein